LSWLPKVTEGFFMRAESFYNFATYIEKVSDLRAYGGKSPRTWASSGRCANSGAGGGQLGALKDERLHVPQATG